MAKADPTSNQPSKSEPVAHKSDFESPTFKLAWARIVARASIDPNLAEEYQKDPSRAFEQQGFTAPDKQALDDYVKAHLRPAINAIESTETKSPVTANYGAAQARFASIRPDDCAGTFGTMACVGSAGGTVGCAGSIGSYGCHVHPDLSAGDVSVTSGIQSTQLSGGSGIRPNGCGACEDCMPCHGSSGTHLPCWTNPDSYTQAVQSTQLRGAGSSTVGIQPDDCSGTAGTIGTAFCAGGCAGTIGSVGSYGCHVHPDFFYSQIPTTPAASNYPSYAQAAHASISCVASMGTYGTIVDPRVAYRRRR